jgi:pimeloyl-ACP methyl ester carboxylesterase
VLIGRGIVLLVAVMLVVGCGEGKPKPERVVGLEGSIVDVGGHFLYFDCVGAGSPTVVLEAGSGGSVRNWHDVQPELAKTTRTCSYDRAGLGGSGDIPGVHDAADEIRDLERLLDRADIGAPYVLVGHSYGGLLVRMFAAAHADDVAGVVLVDSAHPDQSSRFLAALPRGNPLTTTLRRALRLPRVDHGVAVRASFALARAVGSLDDARLVVITAGQTVDPDHNLPPDIRGRLDATWLSLQDDLAHLSTDSVHVIALRSDHFVQSFLTGQPEVVVHAVRAVVGAARGGRPLPSCARLFRGGGVRCA